MLSLCRVSPIVWFRRSTDATPPYVKLNINSGIRYCIITSELLYLRIGSLSWLRLVLGRGRELGLGLITSTYILNKVLVWLSPSGNWSARHNLSLNTLFSLSTKKCCSIFDAAIAGRPHKIEITHMPAIIVIVMRFPGLFLSGYTIAIYLKSRWLKSVIRCARFLLGRRRAEPRPGRGGRRGQGRDQGGGEGGGGAGTGAGTGSGSGPALGLGLYRYRYHSHSHILNPFATYLHNKNNFLIFIP